MYLRKSSGKNSSSTNMDCADFYFKFLLNNINTTQIHNNKNTHTKRNITE